MLSRCFAYCDFAFFALVTLNSAAADLYTRIPTGRHLSEANDINEQGEIVGGAYYFNGNDNILTLGLASTNASYVGLYGLNNLGLAVGASTVGTNHPGPARAFSFNSKTGAIRDLGSLFGPTAESRAYAVNDAGVIVGSSATTNSTRAVRFETDGRVTDLGTLGGSWSEAADINQNGDIVGTSRNSQNAMRAFWIPANGSMIDLGTLGGSNSWAARINNKQEIVGSSETADGSTRAFLYKNGRTIDLGTLGGVSAAFGINDEGTIVGWSWGANREPWTAFIKYPELPMRDLAAITTVDPGDDLFRARAINNRGEIAASIFHPTYRTGFAHTSLLRPGALSGQLRNGQLELRVAAPPGKGIRLEKSNDLSEWQSIFTLSGEAERIQQEPISPGLHFYRIGLIIADGPE